MLPMYWKISTYAFLVLLFASHLLNTSTAESGGGLASHVQPLIERHKGQVGAMVKHLETGESYGYAQDQPMPTASLIKFPLMVAAYQDIEDGKLSLDKPVTLRSEDKVPGSGVLTANFSAGATFPLKDAIHLMIAYSDNTATNLVIDQVGLEATGTLMKSLDCPDTVLHSKVFRRDTSIYPERSKKYGLGSSTAAEMVRLLEALQKEELVSSAASKKMIAHMAAVGGSTKIPRLLPPGTRVIHKTGSVSASRTDAGIILSPAGPIAVCVLTHKNEDRGWADDNTGDMLCSTIAKAAYDYFNADNKQTSEPDNTLQVGSSGLLVEALQRTLNAKLQPSPSLGVDGDFGPMTERAVKAFQRSKKLPESGRVTTETWDALGALVEEHEAPAPEQINSKVIEKSASDDLTGPPFVTCKTWAIGDGKSGEILWSSGPNKRRDIASTTKIMTGFLVTSLAESNPEVLNEIIVFSKRADEMPGSTSGVRAGESISVGELLYGLLLPSGNDASVALAEHFGDRLTPGGAGEGDSYDRFIAAMNAKAKALGMDGTSFANPHGWPHENHYGCAAELLKLAHASMKQPLFRKYVATVQHGSTVTGAEGYKRNIAWRNSNRLLRTEGFVGVKTGTTSAAGACLVSQGERGDRSLIVVVLGSSSTDARYADSQNLYRYAWRQLGSDQSIAKQ